MSKWFHTVKRAYLLDFQMPDSSDQMPIGQARNLRNVDPEKIVRQLHDAGVQALYTHAKDNQGNCYYNTLYGHKHTGLGERDLLKELAAACRKRDMIILYYVQLTRERRGNLEEMYAARREDGTPVIHSQRTPMLPSRDERPVMCLNGPGREYMINICRELSENYDFDGFWLDCYSWWGGINPCYCDFCKGKYLEDTGAALPAQEDKSSGAWKRYFAWRRRLNTIILHEIIRAIRTANPKLTITHNGSGFARWSDIEFCDADDYVTHEFHYAGGYGRLALTCRKNQALKPGVPFEIESWRFFSPGGTREMLRGYQVRPVPQLFTEMATVLANGGLIQYYDQIRPDGSLDERSLERVTAAFDLVRQREEFLGQGQKRVQFASLVWSKQTEAFAAEQQWQSYQAELEGFHYALMEKRVLHDVITERAVRNGEFGDARVVVLPNAICMSEQEAGSLRRFVEEGGGLVATCRTSLADLTGHRRENFLLADLFGADYLEPFSYMYGFSQFDREHPVTADVPLNWPITIWQKKQLKVRPRNAAEGLGNLVNPMRGMHMGYPPQEITPFPAAVVRQVGKGRVVYFPQPLGHCYVDYGHPDTRQLMVNAVLWAAGAKLPIEVDAPETVEVTMWEAALGQRIIHLLNRTAGGPARTRGSVITEVIPLHDIRVRLPQKVARATLQPEGRSLDVRKQGDAWEVIVPRLEIHSMVIVQ